MNKGLRNILNNLSKGFGSFSSNFIASIASFLRVCVLSKISVSLKSRSYSTFKRSKDCSILANGPSLKTALDAGEVRLEDNDVFCVNMFAEADEFWTIKPRFYYLVDGQFFNPSIERCVKQVAFLKEAFKKVDWEMFLCISSGGVNGGVLEDLDNPHIRILRWNTTTFEGFKGLRNFLFRRRMAMPRCQTVTNFALAAAINMKYNNVYLYGADHGWTKDLRVDDDNVCCYGDRHVYNTNLTVIKLQYDIATLLRQYAMMFESHKIINSFAESMGVKIWNCTRDSFVDAYERYY